MNSGEFTIHRPSPCPPSPELHCLPSRAAPSSSAAGGGGEARFSPRTRYVNNFAGSVDDWARMQISFLIPKEKTFLIGAETKLSISSHHPEPDRNEIWSSNIGSSTDIPVHSRAAAGASPSPAGESPNKEPKNAWQQSPARQDEHLYIQGHLASCKPEVCGST